jgi:hypothetical protein
MFQLSCSLPFKDSLLNCRWPSPAQWSLVPSGTELLTIFYCLMVMVAFFKLKLSYDLQWVGQSVLVSGSHLEPMTRFLFSSWQLQASCCGAPSLTIGWVCNLLVQLFLVLARAVTLGSKSRRTHGHILLSHLRLPQPGGPGPGIYIPQEQIIF